MAGSAVAAVMAPMRVRAVQAESMRESRALMSLSLLLMSLRRVSSWLAVAKPATTPTPTMPKAAMPIRADCR